MVNYRKNIISGSVLFVSAAVYFILSFSIKSFSGLGATPLSARFIPQLWGFLLMLLSLVLLVRGIREYLKLRKAGALAKDGTTLSAFVSRNREVILTFTALAVYIVLLDAIGFFIMSAAFIFVEALVLTPAEKRNWVAALLLGPWWAVAIATIIAVLRNAMGLGTLLAFPGGMIGALLAGLFYRYTRNIYMGAAGEILGTGFIAPVVSALFVAPVLMGNVIPLLALIPSFLASTLAGAALGVMAIRLLERADIVHLKA